MRYPKKALNLSVLKGEVLGIAGLIGAGRSEMAKALFGANKHIGGTLKLEGEKIDIRSPKQAINHGIYLVPEDRHICGLIATMTIRENITLPILNRLAKGGLISFEDESNTAKKNSRRCGLKPQVSKHLP